MVVDYCKATVWTERTEYGCSRKAKRDGFCTIHHPEYRAKKNADRREKFDQEWAKQKAMRAAEMHAAKCAEALEGKDPAKLAVLLKAARYVVNHKPGDPCFEDMHGHLVTTFWSFMDGGDGG